jgi:predicted nucleic acid-binding protein
MGLDPEETEAIALALERKIPALLIDDRGGRLAAEQRAIVPIGTVNILEMADIVGLLDFEQAIVKLQATNFRIDKRTVEIARAQFRLRRSQSYADR